MYHQIALTPEDRPLHRFLWRDWDQSKEQPLCAVLRYVFGGYYCPFCTQYAWQKHADDHKAEDPPAVKVVEKSCYMDDLMPSLKWVEMVNECVLMILGSRFGLTISFPKTNTQVFNNDELANLPSLFSIGENINVENVSEFTYLGQTSAIKIKAVLQTFVHQKQLGNSPKWDKCLQTRKWTWQQELS